MQTMNMTQRNFEQQCGFIEPGTFQYAVDRSVSQASFEHGSTVGTEKLCGGGLEPGAHAGAVVPEPARAQIGQGVAHTERRIRDAEPVQIHPGALVALKGQLAGPKTS